MHVGIYSLFVTWLNQWVSSVCCLNLRYADNFDAMQTAVAHALECALDVQNKQGAYLTTVGVTLHIKIGISAGEVIILLLGNDEVACYLELGRAIVAVNKGELYTHKSCKLSTVQVYSPKIKLPSGWCYRPNRSATHFNQFPKSITRHT